MSEESLGYEARVEEMWDRHKDDFIISSANCWNYSPINELETGHLLRAANWLRRQWKEDFSKFARCGGYSKLAALEMEIKLREVK